MHAAPAPGDPLRHRRAPKSPGRPGTPPRGGQAAGASLLSFATAPAPRTKRPTPTEASPVATAASPVAIRTKRPTPTVGEASPTLPPAASSLEHGAWGAAEHATRLLQQLAPLADVELST